MSGYNRVRVIESAEEKDEFAYLDDFVFASPAEDLSGIKLNDGRLNNRLQKLLEDITYDPSGSILASSSDGRTGAKAAYRLLSNERFDAELVKEEAYAGTVERINFFKEYEPILAIQDLTEVNYNTHKKTIELGYCNQYSLGIRLHSCIAVTASGIPLGVLYQDAYTRLEKKDNTPVVEKQVMPIEEKESYRWIETLAHGSKIVPSDVDILYVADREADFYEYIAFAVQNALKILVRMKYDRNIPSEEDNESLVKIKTLIKSFEIAGSVDVDIPRDSRNNVKARTASLDISYGKATIPKPVYRTEEHLASSVEVNIIYVNEPNPEEGIEPIEWYLITLTEIDSFEKALEYVGYYTKRWIIERFHYVLKSGCNVEKLQERTYKKLRVALFLYSMVAIYLMVMTYLGRVHPNLSCEALFDEFEWKLLQSISRKEITEEAPTISEAIMLIARLGGFAGAPSDGFPGAKVIWRGYGKLQFAVDIIPLTWNSTNQLAESHSSNGSRKTKKKKE